MTMPNREIAALNRESRAREELTVAIKSGQGKEYRKERELWEKAAGGKKHLANAQKVLVNAEKKYVDIVIEGKARAAEIAKAAVEKIALAEVILNERARVATNREFQHDQSRDTLLNKSAEIEETTQLLVAREEAVVAGESALVSANNLVAARENAASIREHEIKRFEDWRAAAPA